MTNVKKLVNGQFIELTSSELTAIESETARYEAEERERPMTESEVTRLLIAQQINALEVDDSMALRMVEFYPAWMPETDYPGGVRVRHGGGLYKCIQAHTSQESWAPGLAPSLWGPYHSKSARLALPYVEPSGAHDAYQEGEYMIWTNGKIYRCKQDGTAWGPDVVAASWEVMGP